jgi:integrase
MGTETLAATAALAEAKKRRARAGKPDRGIFEKVPGSGIWWIRYVDAQGRYRREKAGTWGNADKLLIKRRNDALQGKKLPETLRRRAVQFSELCDQTEIYIRKKYAQPDHDLGRLRTIRRWFGSRAADSITPQDVELTLDRAKAEYDWSESSYNHYHTLISLSYRLAIRNKQVQENPAHGVDREIEDNSRVRYLAPDEEARLRQVIRDNPAWAGHEPELDLALATGLRRSSMFLYLEWKNVNLTDCVARIPRTKNGELIDIPLNADAVRAIKVFKSRADGTGPVVRNVKGERLLHPHWFVPAVRAANIQNFCWHDLRHTFASRLRQKGVPLANIAELLGHKGLKMTLRYAHLGISDYQKDVAKIESSDSTPVAPEPVVISSDVAYVQ